MVPAEKRVEVWERANEIAGSEPLTAKHVEVGSGEFVFIDWCWSVSIRQVWATACRSLPVVSGLLIVARGNSLKITADNGEKPTTA